MIDVDGLFDRQVFTCMWPYCDNDQMNIYVIC